MKIIVNKPHELAEFAGYVLLFVLGPLLIVPWEMPRLGLVVLFVGVWLERWRVIRRYERRITKLSNRVDDLDHATDYLRAGIREERAKRQIAEKALRDLAQAREQFARSSLN